CNPTTHSFPTRRSSDLTKPHQGDVFALRHGHDFDEIGKLTGNYPGPSAFGNDRPLGWLIVNSNDEVIKRHVRPLQSGVSDRWYRSEEHTSELQSPDHLV